MNSLKNYYGTRNTSEENEAQIETDDGYSSSTESKLEHAIMATCGRKKAIAKPAPRARDPSDVETIERLQQRIQELEFQQLRKDSPAEETKTESND
ncbi:hypothetical protein Tco_0931845 [Tanacetum coccineum]